MHPEGKLANHGKTSSNGGQSQPPNVSQGPKGTGLLGPKANHMSPSGVGLKSGQNQGSNHGKGQRDTAEDVGDQREPGTPLLNTDNKELPTRSKRRCVLERKQPYSGDEWCSGPDSEEDEKTLVASHIDSNAGDSVMSAPTLPGSGPASLHGLNDSSSSSTPHGVNSNVRESGGLVGPSKPTSQLVYVFTTNMANTAAEAVLQGRADSILLYHQQNVPRAKLDEATLQRPSSAPDLDVAVSTSSIPSSTPIKTQNLPSPAKIQAPPAALAEDTGPEEVKQELTPNPIGNGNSRPGSSHSNPPPQSAGPLPGVNLELGDTAQGNDVTLNPEGLSREQLEHRERSLQTLRDIERLLLRSGSVNESFPKHTQSPTEGTPLPPPPPPHQTNTTAPIKKYEEPLQSMITQTQSLGAPVIEQDVGGTQPGPDMGHQMSLMMQRLGQDSLTPEQAAWRKLQEEYYAEKRRKEEHMSIHGRAAPDIMLRGPPPPYHSKPGEQWIGSRLPLEGQEPMPLRGSGMTFQGPRFPGRYAAMQNIPMDTMSVLQRPARWTEEITPVGGGPAGFPQGGMAYPGNGQGEMERFLNPRSRDELLRQQLMEKRPAGMQRQLPTGQGLEMERVMMTHRQNEHSMFAGDGMAGGPAMGMDFGGARGMLSPTLSQPGTGRELDPSIGGGNLNMNMSVNMNMNLNLQMAPHQQMLLSQKMRSGGDQMGPQGVVGSEDLMRASRSHNGGGMAGGPQKILIPGQFPQAQSGFPAGQSPYSSIQQEMSMDMFGTDQGPLGNTSRLSHMPMSSASGTSSTSIGPVHMTSSRGMGRRPTELTISVNQMESPIISHLKSPTIGQVSSPIVSSPSANLKSPQTPGAQMAGLPSSNPSSSLKSPQMLTSSISGRSPSNSPGRLKSPQLTVPSPGWVPSPKATMPSPGIPSGKPVIGINPTTSLGAIEQDGTHSQNPLSLMMSQMSKYAMPSSTPLYHNAIKTIATSDDELLPERVLLPPGAQQGPGMNQPMSLHLNLNSSQSPMGNISLPGQAPLSHDTPPSLLTSPGPPMHPTIVPPMQNSLMIPSVTQDPCCPGPNTQMMSSNQLVFPPRVQSRPHHNPPIPQGGGGSSMQQHYPDDVHTQPRLSHRMSDPYGPGLPSVLSDPDLGDVIRPSASGIPEFDLSRIMPSEKPSSTLQYFPKVGNQTPKPHPTNMHLLGLQNMMVEQHAGHLGPSLPGSQRTLGVPPMPTMGRTGLAPPPQMAQQNFMLMKQRSVSGEMYPQNAHMLSPQGALGGHIPGQQSMMVGHQMRQRSVSLDTYITGTGHLPF
ncbi:B-cell CLL/lymphoma 9-like protein isoform X3 [Spea bombifrons]|uniref:B-cell CLL/lymphoma 9-like protein isoform X3 n=1 Tax=Spea bombifrons TaxID=233779 RepID=UPI00234A0DF4|nr:B-cell CLL/lymphoma 9-like protein isoform X3 [Spea bombifrons]